MRSAAMDIESVASHGCLSRKAVESRGQAQVLVLRRRPNVIAAGRNGSTMYMTLSGAHCLERFHVWVVHRRDRLILGRAPSAAGEREQVHHFAVDNSG